jgi:outer membrane protein assembly factor BamB
MRCLLLLLSALGVAHADASLPDAKCSFMTSPFYLAQSKKPPMNGSTLAARTATRTLWRTANGHVLEEKNDVRTLPDASQVAAIVERGDALIGFVAVGDHKMTYLDATMKPIWQAPVSAYGDAAAALLDGKNLVVAIFPRIASGAQLYKLDAASGRLLWTGDVEQLNASHSQYFNDVELFREGQDIVMRGYEGGCYVQRLDSATGRRLSSTISRPCSHRSSPYFNDSARRDPPRPGVTFVQRSSAHSLWLSAVGSEVHSTKKGPPLELPAMQAAALVERGNELLGVLAVDGVKHQLSFYDAATAARRWTTVIDDLWGDSAAAVVDGSSVIVTTFHRIATGSQLYRLDLSTGRVEWKADVEQLNVGHSKYFNDVVVSIEYGNVTLNGYEALGCYIQTFDPATGKRRSSKIFGR